jgi:hypothetical protein
MSIAKTVAAWACAQTPRPRLLFVVAFAWLCVCGLVTNAADKASSAQEQSVDRTASRGSRLSAVRLEGCGKSMASPIRQGRSTECLLISM